MPETDEDGFGFELHNQGGISGSGDATSSFPALATIFTSS